MHLHRRVEAYLRASDTPPTKFGRLAARDPRLVFDMRQGREIGRTLAARIHAFIDGREAEQGAAACTR